MTPHQIQLVRTTFSMVMHQKQEVGRLFYDRLFAIAPDTRTMFGSDINLQARKLMDTLAMAIGSLRDSATLVPMLEGLARRHVRYGVRDEHYDQVGRALLDTLEKGLGNEFTPEVREAWTTLYGTVAAVMRKAARQPVEAVA